MLNHTFTAVRSTTFVHMCNFVLVYNQHKVKVPQRGFEKARYKLKKAHFPCHVLVSLNTGAIESILTGNIKNCCVMCTIACAVGD